MNDHTLIISRVIKDLKRRGYFLKYEKAAFQLTYSYLQPVWKWAFYNPAKPDKNGSVVIVPFPSIIIFTIMLGVLIIGSLIDKLYIPLIVAFPLFIGTIIYSRYLYNTASMTVNATGITFEGATYHWEDYIAAFYCMTPHGKSSIVDLVLVKQDGSYSYLHLDPLRKFSSIGTAIRDFQPESWKEFKDMYADHALDGATKGVIVVDA